MTNAHDSHAVAHEKSESQLRSRGLSYTQFLQEWVFSLLGGRRIESVEIRADGMAWFLTLDSGRRIYLEPVVTNAGCYGMLAAPWPAPMNGEPSFQEFCEARMA